jgi:hypothetical protein
MTQSFEVGEIDWSPERNDNPTAVISIEIGGIKYIMDLVTYNDNIESGKTKFITMGEGIYMVTDEQYKLLSEANQWIKK